MSAAPKFDPVAPQGAPPTPSPPKRHLELVPPPPAPVDDEDRRVRATRWIAALLVVATAALFGLWTAAMLGAADAVWWPAVLGLVFVGVVVLGIVVMCKTR